MKDGKKIFIFIVILIVVVFSCGSKNNFENISQKGWRLNTFSFIADECDVSLDLIIIGEDTIQYIDSKDVIYSSLSQFLERKLKDRELILNYISKNVRGESLYVFEVYSGMFVSYAIEIDSKEEISFRLINNELKLLNSKDLSKHSSFYDLDKSQQPCDVFSTGLPGQIHIRSKFDQVSNSLKTYSVILTN